MNPMQWTILYNGENCKGLLLSIGIEPTTLSVADLCSNQMNYDETLCVATVLNYITKI